MLKLFAKFYFMIILGFIGAQLTLSFFVGGMISNEVNEDILSKTQGVSYLLKESLRNIPEEKWKVHLSELQKHFGYPIRIIPIDEIQLNERQIDEVEKFGRFVISDVPVMGDISLSIVQKVNDKLYLSQHINSQNDTVSPLDILPIAVWLLSLAFFIFIVTYPLYRRLNRLSNVASQLSTGNFDIAIPSDKGHETEKLASTLKILTNRVSELLESQRQFLRIVAHEFRTPMTRIQFMLEDIRNECNADSIRDIEHELYELNEMVSDLGKYIYLHEQESSHLNLSVFSMQDLLNQIENQISNFDKKIISNIYCSNDIYLDKKMLAYVLRNLLTNAYKFSNNQVILNIIQYKHDLEISVEDDGPGVSEDHHSLIFTAFHKDSVKGGLGLGLAIVHRIVVHLFKGTITVKKSRLGGLQIECKIPLLELN